MLFQMEASNMENNNLEESFSLDKFHFKSKDFLGFKNELRNQ